MKKEWLLVGDDAVTNKLQKLKASLKNWNKNIFGNIDQAIKILEFELDIIGKLNESRDLDKVEMARKLALQSHIENWYV